MCHTYGIEETPSLSPSRQQAWFGTAMAPLWCKWSWSLGRRSLELDRVNLNHHDHHDFQINLSFNSRIYSFLQSLELPIPTPGRARASWYCAVADGAADGWWELCPSDVSSTAACTTKGSHFSWQSWTVFFFFSSMSCSEVFWSLLEKFLEVVFLLKKWGLLRLVDWSKGGESKGHIRNSNCVITEITLRLWSCWN